VLAGCMAERLGEKAKEEFPAVDFVMGTSARSRFPLILEAIERGNFELTETDEKPEFSFSAVHLDLQEDGRAFRCFIPIMHGCNNYCSFCIVPHVRGREVSRDPASILEEIRIVGERGVREITLLGQNVNSYSWEDSGGKLDFPGLLERVAQSIDSTGVKWIRFLSSHPKDFSTEAIRVIAENPSLCRHILLCVQHVSNKVLKAMNRRYTREQYLELVASLRRALPNVSLSTDILVGFPGETEDDVQQTLALMEEVKFLYAYMYHFNPREGTAAYSLPDRISEDVKRERLSRVIALQKRHTRELLKSRVGQEAIVLIEGISKKNADELISRTERDEMVVVPAGAGKMGSFARVTLSSLRGNTFRS
jgi:tRNA-2-methylthio-N6-dimethylallyladenosine synthase